MSDYGLQCPPLCDVISLQPVLAYSAPLILVFLIPFRVTQYVPTLWLSSLHTVQKNHGWKGEWELQDGLFLAQAGPKGAVPSQRDHLFLIVTKVYVLTIAMLRASAHTAPSASSILPKIPTKLTPHHFIQFSVPMSSERPSLTTLWSSPSTPSVSNTL